MISAYSGSEYSIVAIKDGVTLTVPRTLLNADYREILGLQTVLIDRRENVYNAFPDLRKIGGSLVGIYSTGAGHANSDGQMMARSDDGGHTWQTKRFFDNATLAYDPSLLDGLLAVGDIIVFKNFSVKKNVSGYSCASHGTVSNGSVKYALWGQPIRHGGILLRTGYGVNGTDTETALLQSVDGGLTWSFRSLIARVAGRKFSEAALIECADGSVLSVIREDGFNKSRFMVWTRSVDGGTIWSSPVQFDFRHINGTQPFLIRLSNNSLLLMAGDRVGASGLNSIGIDHTGQQITGISCWKSTDNGNTWTYRTMIDAMWSTDGGQPVAVQTEDGKIACLFYHAFNGLEEPAVECSIFDPDGIV
ncbi:sialidase family protein [Paenibacillus sp. MBLB4367]|uniref:sialidase family protein n=1 Tax=Paenibacillus sp. MBLB4367 TaxID=3384767 RepID=UPI0039081A26